MLRRLLLPTLVLTLLGLAAAAAGPASAFRLGGLVGPVAGNPADALRSVTPDPIEYDAARRCDPKAKPGVVRMVKWLEANAAGANWGTYRCEKWGADSASLHAENRAIDWRLDSRVPAQRAAGKKLIRLLLAPDADGTPFALARRMGVEELIWDCSYWGAGMEEFSRYSSCFSKKGTRLARPNPTVAHMDHIHIGISKAGAAARTSFWAAARR